MPTARKISFALLASAICLAIFLHLGSAVLAGFFSYMILETTHRALNRRVNEFLSRWLSVFIFSFIALSLAWLFWGFIRLSLSRMPLILDNTIPKIVSFAADYSLPLPFDNPQELRALLLQSFKANARSITLESFVLTRESFEVIVAIFIAMLHFLESRRRIPRDTLFDAVYEEFAARVGLFKLEFEKVIGAQFVIAAVNALLTAILLLSLQIPFFRFLTLSTFMLGMLPVIGNLISNALIAGTALMLSPEHVVAALVALVLLHKIEYLVNSRIISSSVNLPTWQVLLGILIGQLLLGVSGIVLAPAVITHIRKEMQSIRHVSKAREAAA